jgi:hypothetical protein
MQLVHLLLMRMKLWFHMHSENDETYELSQLNLSFGDEGYIQFRGKTLVQMKNVIEDIEI